MKLTRRPVLVITSGKDGMSNSGSAVAEGLSDTA